MKLIGFDIESSGTVREYALQPFRVGTGAAWITSYAYAVQTPKGILSGGKLSPTVDDLREFLNGCRDKGATIVGWNTPFDVAWLLAMGLHKEVYENKWLDAMLLWRHLTLAPEFLNTSPKSYGLKAAVETFYPTEAGYEKDIDFAATDLKSLVRLASYNQKDASYTLLLAMGFLEGMPADQKRNALLEAACIPMVAEATVRGITVDNTAAEALDASLRDTAAVSLVKLKLGGDTDVTEAVLGSPKQLAELLFDKWKLPAIKLTDKGARSTDKSVLHELALIDERAGWVHEYREAVGNRIKFVANTHDSLIYNADGCTRPQARIYGTYTGRMTYSSTQGKGVAAVQTGVALHQWKRDKKFRALIKPPAGYTLLEFDFAGQEFRWMAVESGDRTMLDLCAPGEDAHAYMGARIASVDYRTLMRDAHLDAAAKHMRSVGKFANLSCIAAGEPVLTDRGYVPIECVRRTDKLWDGIEWVDHDGVVFKGIREVITYAGITATPDHKVWVGRWVEFAEAVRHGWQIESPLGAGWSGRCRAAIRIVDGVVRRAVHDVHSQGICELRGARDRVQVCVREGWRGLHTVSTAVAQLCRTGLGSHRQQRALRAGQPATGNTFGEPKEQATYDLLNAGPRARFSVGACIVSNCQYRTSAPTIRKIARSNFNIPMTDIEAAAIHATYQTTYRKVPQYWDRQIRRYKQSGVIQTLAGRRIQLVCHQADALNNKWSIESTAINFPIQGVGADQKYLALAVLRNQLPKWDAHFYFELHDGLFVIVPNAKAEACARALKHILSNLPYKKAWGVDLPIRFPVDAKMGRSWGDLEELK